MRNTEQLRKLARECRQQAESASVSAVKNLLALAEAYEAEADRQEAEEGSRPAGLTES